MGNMHVFVHRKFAKHQNKMAAYALVLIDGHMFGRHDRSSILQPRELRRWRTSGLTRQVDDGALRLHDEAR